MCDSETFKPFQIRCEQSVQHGLINRVCLVDSPVAQLIERAIVNRQVASLSLAGRANFNLCSKNKGRMADMAMQRTFNPRSTISPMGVRVPLRPPFSMMDQVAGIRVGSRKQTVNLPR